MQRQLILDIQRDVDGAGQPPRFQHWGGFQIGAAVDRVEFGLHLRKIRHTALSQLRHVFLEAADKMIVGALHAQAIDLPLDHQQPNDAIIDLLLRHRYQHGQITGGMVGLLKRATGALDVGNTFTLAKKGRDRFFDRGFGEPAVAFNGEFKNVKPCAGWRRRHLSGCRHAAGQPQQDQAREHSRETVPICGWGRIHRQRNFEKLLLQLRTGRRSGAPQKMKNATPP